MKDGIEINSMMYRIYCPECRYDLTGNESNVCPECGRGFDSLRLRRWAVEGSRRSYLVGAILVTILFPFVGVIALYYSIQTIRASKRRDMLTATEYSAKAFESFLLALVMFPITIILILIVIAMMSKLFG